MLCGQVGEEELAWQPRALESKQASRGWVVPMHQGCMLHGPSATGRWPKPDSSTREQL